ncbi:MAG: glycosyltransferase family 4 protein [Actinomycetota bacterium]|nr:glycosyltransferase family 4 protein [Actinomycetota bacterium]
MVAILHLGRSTAKGEAVRVRSWAELIDAAGGQPEPVALLSDHRSGAGVDVRAMASVLGGHAVPEAALWSAASVLARLDQLQPRAIVCVTSRAFRPELVTGRWVTILDHVDLLSVSYGERSLIARSLPRRMTYATLGHTARRFEVKSPGLASRQVAAGWTDARALGAEWVPITVTPRERVRIAPAGPDAVDVCFVGTLSYPPNVEALEVLGSAWPAVQHAWPGATALVAGSNPVAKVRQLAHQHRWTLLPNFTDADDVYSRARLAVSPLLTASGIQIKVLEAAAYGVPQIVLPAAIAGFEPGFPVRVARDRFQVADEIVHALRNPGPAADQATRACALVGDRYVAATWAPVVRELLNLARSDSLTSR